MFNDAILKRELPIAAVIALLSLLLTSCVASDVVSWLDDPRTPIQRSHGIWPEVWSQHAPGVESYEFKVNCNNDGGIEDPCFLTDLDAVIVHAPDGRVHHLERDFNVQEYSGEITRRYVLYGPPNGGLPPPGDYIFRYRRDGAVVFEQAFPYSSSVIDYPKDVTWQRVGPDLHVQWTPPEGMTRGMNYKVIIWNEPGTPDVLASRQVEWNGDSAVLLNVPFIAGGTYSLNVAAFYNDGYSYSEYVIFTWSQD